jgi:hypothetical protein
LSSIKAQLKQPQRQFLPLPGSNQVDAASSYGQALRPTTEKFCLCML